MDKRREDGHCKWWKRAGCKGPRQGTTGAYRGVRCRRAYRAQKELPGLYPAIWQWLLGLEVAWLACLEPLSPRQPPSRAPPPPGQPSNSPPPGSPTPRRRDLEHLPLNRHEWVDLSVFTSTTSTSLTFPSSDLSPLTLLSYILSILFSSYATYCLIPPRSPGLNFAHILWLARIERLSVAVDARPPRQVAARGPAWRGRRDSDSIAVQVQKSTRHDKLDPRTPGHARYWA